MPIPALNNAMTAPSDLSSFGARAPKDDKSDGAVIALFRAGIGISCLILALGVGQKLSVPPLVFNVSIGFGSRISELKLL